MSQKQGDGPALRSTATRDGCPFTSAVARSLLRREEGCSAPLGAGSFWLAAAVGVSNPRKMLLSGLREDFLALQQRVPVNKLNGMTSREGTELERSCEGLCSIAAF